MEIVPTRCYKSILEQYASQGLVFYATKTKAVDFFAHGGEVVTIEHPERNPELAKKKYGLVHTSDGVYLLHVEPEIRGKDRKMTIGIIAETHDQVTGLTRRLLDEIS